MVSSAWMAANEGLISLSIDSHFADNNTNKTNSVLGNIF